jgi:hypothetical protein
LEHAWDDIAYKIRVEKTRRNYATVEDNIKIDVTEIEHEGMKLIRVAQGRDEGRGGFMAL